jgi:hypothetical protein
LLFQGYQFENIEELGKRTVSESLLEVSGGDIYNFLTGGGLGVF